MESRDIVRRLIEKDGSLLVAFHGHAGYFQIPLADAVLCAKIRDALGKEVFFAFDKDLKISSVYLVGRVIQPEL